MMQAATSLPRGNGPWQRTSSEAPEPAPRPPALEGYGLLVQDGTVPAGGSIDE